jgi:hypothetical protein
LQPWFEHNKQHEITVVVSVMKPLSIFPKSTRLLNPPREVLRCKHYSLSTEEADIDWVTFFVRWHGQTAGCALSIIA